MTFYNIQYLMTKKSNIHDRDCFICLPLRVYLFPSIYKKYQ